VKANSSLSSHEISRISRNPKVHYRTHNSRVPSYVNPAHIFPSHLNIHFHSTHPSTPFRTSDLVFHRNTVGYATTNTDATTNSFYQYQDATTNTDATTNSFYHYQDATTNTDATTNSFYQYQDATTNTYATTNSFYQYQDATTNTDATTNSFYQYHDATTNAGGILSPDVPSACA